MAGNSKDSKILAYKDMINQLNKTISAQTELIQSLQKTLEADRLEKENLRQQIEYLTKKLFGTSSEKRKDIDGQLNLFDEAEQEADLTWKQELPDDITVPEHKRKSRRTHTDLFKNVPSCDEIISLPEEERNCPTCGTQMECIGKEFVRHEFRFTPAKGKVVNIYRETYKCPECAISEEHPDDQTFVKAPVQEPLIPESYASESVVGWAMHQKYQNGLPLNRQEADPAWKPELPDDITVPEHKRKARRTHAELFKNVPSCDEILSLPEEERNCPTCGTQMECIGKEFVRHEFRFTPAKGKVVNIYRETYKCPECARSEEHPDDQTFVKAPVQEPLIPESYASESVVAWAMHQKYQNGLPLKRQEEDWKQLGVPLSRATLANWIIYCAENYLRHVYDYFHRQLLKRKYLMADELCRASHNSSYAEKFIM